MSTQQRIHVYASFSNYLDHIAPVWHALPDDVKGEVLIEKPALRSHPLVEAAGRRLKKPVDIRRVSRVLVAGSHDANVAARYGWGTALMEHGAGQLYQGGKPSSSGPGGKGRTTIGLFLCTNEAVRQANDATAPGRAVVTGFPRLADLELARSLHTPSQEPVLALAWHWQCNVARPYSVGLLPEFRHSLVRLRSLWRGPIIGHSHPRVWRLAQQVYRQAGIEPVEHWADVVRRADVVSFDNTSVGWEAAALGIPVVLCESRMWSREVEHGLRFWKWADIGPSVRDDTYPEALAQRWVDGAVEALTRRDVYGPRMEAMAAEVYPHRTPDLAVDALLRWIGSPS